MAYKKVVEMLGENLASFLELAKKLLIDWEVDPKQLLHTLQNLRKADLLGLINGTHQIQKKRVETSVKIDRSIPFDPKPFIDDEWTIEEQDERSLALTEIELTEVMFDSTLKRGEKSIKGEDKLKRLKEKTNRIRLDAGIFKTLWENQILIPEKWKKQTNGNMTFIFFDGTILRGFDGERSILYLYWSCGRWDWGYDWLEDDRSADDPSAVLEQKEAA